MYLFYHVFLKKHLPRDGMSQQSEVQIIFKKTDREISPFEISAWRNYGRQNNTVVVVIRSTFKGPPRDLLIPELKTAAPGLLFLE
jgi:hypothetical protein